MAIALDTSTNLGSTGGTTLTASHTCSGSNRILFVHVRTAGTTDTLTSITYAGSAMTLVNKKFGINNLGTYLYYIIAPSTGANNVVINTSVAAISAIAVSYTGAKQSAQPDANNTNENASTTGLNTNITVVASNCWAIMGVDSGSGNDAAGTNATLRQAGPNTGVTVFDSNGTIATGSFTMGFSCDLGSANCVLASFAPSLTTAYTMTADQGSYTLTGFAAIIGRVFSMVAAFGSYVLTGFATTFTFHGWFNQNKSSTSFSNQSKSSTSFSNQSKSSSSWNNQSKS